ncbi:Uncharacterised protein [Streptococcus pneumoniae]|nr:Uncharacterised protein [Streptococcus pneumoniae]
MSIFQPVNLAARRAFCPRLPIANDSWWSGTTTVVAFSSSSTSTLTTCDGLNAFATYSTGSFDQRTMSIFSPFNSSTMRCTRCPFGPTQEPTGSTSVFSAYTEILERSPASRATERISTVPS